jgi:hypothetical protein
VPAFSTWTAWGWLARSIRSLARVAISASWNWLMAWARVVLTRVMSMAVPRLARFILA